MQLDQHIPTSPFGETLISAGDAAAGRTMLEAAPLASPVFSGVPEAPTADPGTVTEQIATTAFVQGAIDALVDAAPGQLNTLNEIAAALNDDANAYNALSSQIAAKQDAVSGTVGNFAGFNGASALQDSGYSPDSFYTPSTLPSTTSGQSVLGAGFNLTSGVAAYEDTGLSVSLPSAGTYLLVANVRATVWMASGTGFIVAKLFDATAAADVANSERIAQLALTTVQQQTTTPLSALVTVSGSATIKLYAKRDGGGSFTNSLIASDNNGRTTMSFFKLAD